MSKTVIDLDEDLLTRAQQILGTGTKKETVNRALREVIVREARRRDRELARSGAYQTLADPEERARAWR